jgi:hypothetical protein
VRRVRTGVLDNLSVPDSVFKEENTGAPFFGRLAVITGLQPPRRLWVRLQFTERVGSKPRRQPLWLDAYKRAVHRAHSIRYHQQASISALPGMC